MLRFSRVLNVSLRENNILSIRLKLKIAKNLSIIIQ